jgi:hypothetical protein
MALQNNLDTLMQLVSTLKSTPYMPTRVLQNPLSAPPHALANQVHQLTAAVKPAGAVAAKRGTVGTPLQATSCVAKPNTATKMMSVSFHRAADTNFSSVRVWLTGYQKNKQPQLLASGVQSPVTFPYTATGENVGVIVQTVGPTGATSDLASGAHHVAKLA